MHITYKPTSPDDGERREWDFDPKSVSFPHAVAVQRAFGATWDEFEAAIQKGDILARRVLLWHLMTLEHPHLQLRDTPQFATGELEVAYSLTELQAIRADVAGTHGMPDQARDQMLAVIDRDITKAMAREGVGEVVDAPAGKAPARPMKSLPAVTG